MNTAELDAAWGALPTPELSQRLQAVALAGHGVWAAVDQLGRRHLLLQVPERTEAPPTSTRGLTATVARHQVHGAEPATYLDLVCQAADAVPTFTAVAADIGAEVASAALEDRVAAVLYALRRWQWFWGVEADQLSVQDALGLFGELWFLDRWAGISAANVVAWTASAGARHDFQWPSVSVEVKTATRRADGAVLHRIQHLDQLADAEQGDLFLFSLRVVRDELARNSLPDLAERITTRLAADQPTADLFAQKLGQRGYSPAHRHRYDVPYRVLGEILYRVADGFPRLTPESFVGGMPSGVTDVTYVLDIAACDPWLVASAPSGWPPGSVSHGDT